MFGKSQKRTEKELLELLNSRQNNNKCCECGSAYPTWASCNLGIFLCGRCSSLHKKVLGSDISFVKSLSLDNWSSDQIDRLARIGNRKSLRTWNPKRVPFPFDWDDQYALEQYIKDKYIEGAFRDDGETILDYEDMDRPYSSRDRSYSARNRSHSDSSKSFKAAYDSRHSSRRSSRRSTLSVPTLSHRKTSAAEANRYAPQVGRILNLGYGDKDSVIEAVCLSNGNIDLALDILEQDIRSNPARTEKPPSLPRRPTLPSDGRSFSSNNPMASLLNPDSQQQLTSNEWWNRSSPNSSQQLTSNSTAASFAVPQEPQIYQYTDPNTGMVNYIDSNGQQYVDTNNPHHQQMFLQQSPLFTPQMSNKTDVLSMYNQAGSLASPNIPSQMSNQSTGFFQPQATGFFTSNPPPQNQPQQTGYFQPQATGYSNLNMSNVMPPMQTGYYTTNGFTYGRT